MPSTMLLKQLLPVAFFSIMTFVVASDTALSARAAIIDRALSSFILCLASGAEFNDCCPSGANPNDGACTLLSCVNFDNDNVTIRDTCDCSQIEVACGQVAMFADLVANLSEMCIAVDNCCDDGGDDGADSTLYAKNVIDFATTTSNSEFDRCMATTIEESGLAMPDIEALLPSDDGMTDGSVSSAGDSTGTTATTTTTSSTTTTTTTSTTSSALPQQKTVELSVNTNDATGYAVPLAASFIGSSFAMLLV